MLETIDHGKVREIKLARPPANALDEELVNAFTLALAEAGEKAGAVVVSGLPGMFSAGLDVPQLLHFDRTRLSLFWQSFLRMLKTIAHMPVPTVFAMTGHAPAGGIVMALFSDYRIMPRGSFKTGLNEVQVGLMVPPPVHHALVRAVGSHTAERILVSGEMMLAEKALEIGLIDELADDPQTTVAQAIEWCKLRLALPQPAMHQTRKMVRADLHAFFDAGSELGIEHFVNIWFSDSTQTTLGELAARLAKK